MTPELLLTLMTWASQLSGYPMPTEIPEIQFKSHLWFVVWACPTTLDCDVLAWYNDDGIVYLDESLDRDSRYIQGVIVHEFVHYQQDLELTYMEPCAREKEAYRIHTDFMSKHFGATRSFWTNCKLRLSK